MCIFYTCRTAFGFPTSEHVFVSVKNQLDLKKKRVTYNFDNCTLHTWYYKCHAQVHARTRMHTHSHVQFRSDCNSKAIHLASTNKLPYSSIPPAYLYACKWASLPPLKIRGAQNVPMSLCITHRMNISLDTFEYLNSLLTCWTLSRYSLVDILALFNILNVH